MRKQYVLAVVDDEEELTYYEIKLQKLTGACAPSEIGSCDAVLVGKSAMILVPRGPTLRRPVSGNGSMKNG